MTVLRTELVAQSLLRAHGLTMPTHGVDLHGKVITFSIVIGIAELMTQFIDFLLLLPFLFAIAIFHLKTRFGPCLTTSPLADPRSCDRARFHEPSEISKGYLKAAAKTVVNDTVLMNLNKKVMSIGGVERSARHEMGVSVEWGHPIAPSMSWSLPCPRLRRLRSCSPGFDGGPWSETLIHTDAIIKAVVVFRSVLCGLSGDRHGRSVCLSQPAVRSRQPRSFVFVGSG